MTTTDTINKLHAQARIVHLMGRLALLIDLPPSDLNQLLNKLETRLLDYEREFIPTPQPPTVLAPQS